MGTPHLTQPSRSLACLLLLLPFHPNHFSLEVPHRPGNTRSLFLFFLPGFCTFCCGARFSLSFLTFLPLIVLLRDSPSVPPLKLGYHQSVQLRLSLYDGPVTSSAFVITARRCRTSATVQSPCRPKGASETRLSRFTPRTSHENFTELSSFLLSLLSLVFFPLNIYRLRDQ
jgi:hypothetical protein